MSIELDEITQGVAEFLSMLKGVSPAEIIKSAVLEMYHREMKRLPGLRLGDDGCCI